MNIMQQLRIEKITLNIGAGKDQAVLKKGQKLIKNITGIDPVQTKTKKRIPSWGLRPGLQVGCKLTLRGKEAAALLKRLLNARSDRLSPSNFDAEGNLAFGVPEYIDIQGVKYDPEIGIMGLEVAVTITRPGYRIKSRRIRRTKIPKSSRVTKEETMEFMKKEFNIKIGDEE